MALFYTGLLFLISPWYYGGFGDYWEKSPGDGSALLSFAPLQESELFSGRYRNVDK